MSESNNSNSVAPDDAGEQSQTNESYVHRKAYEDVSRDMHKYKQKAKELEASVNEFQTQLKAQEEQKMQEQEQWKELYEKRQAELEQYKKQAEMERNKSLQTARVSALRQEIGANVRDEYLRYFAPLDKIVVNDDGTVDKDSLREAANSFRKEHGQLLPQSDSTNITGHAASSPTAPPPADILKMSTRERVEYFTKIKNQ